MPSLFGSGQFINRVKEKFFSEKIHRKVPDSSFLVPDIGKIKAVICEYYSIREEELLTPKGSLRNKFAILSVEAPVWQGTKAQEYQAYFELS
ncbi:MAG: hypothetical protein PHQ97_12005 [Desulfobacterales bacterium]|nr:hypothetical protein [Desulfobacterales bacterium]